jgi:hypothetical protein
MPVYAKILGDALVLPTSFPTAKPLGSIYVNGTNMNALTYRDFTSADTPLISGVLATSEIFIKRKQNLSGFLIPVDSAVSILPNGSITSADSVGGATNVIGTSLEPIPNASYGAILLIGPSSVNILDGLGFTAGDMIYLGSTPGSLTNDLESIVGTAKMIGIADCPSDTQSGVATDLILTTESGGGGLSSITITASISISRGYPVTINSSGLLALIDITDEASAYAFCGVTSLDCLLGGSANVLGAGSTLIDIPASFGLTGQFGVPIFVSHAGSLTTIKPEVGAGDFVSQDFILSVGITTKNSSTGTTDLILNPRIVGRLA